MSNLTTDSMRHSAQLTLKLKALNDHIDNIKLIPTELIHEGNYLIRLLQHLQIYCPGLLQFANRLAASLQSLYLDTNLKIVNIQVFEAHPFDNPEHISASIEHFQIQYQIIPSATVVCWIPLDMDTGSNHVYSLTTVPLMESTCSPKRDNQKFKVTQGVQGWTINTQGQPPIPQSQKQQPVSQSQIITLQPGQILIQNQASGPNQISGQVAQGQNYRMLAISFHIESLLPLMSKL